MAYEEINIGAENAGTGDTPFVAWTKSKAMFLDLYTLTTVSVTGATSLTSTGFGKLHICSGTSADYTVDLPTAVGNEGYAISFKGDSALTKIVTVDANGGELIAGLLTRSFTAGGGFTLISDGANWLVAFETPSNIIYTPTTVGWSSFTSNNCRYSICGKLVTLSIVLSGSSNSTSTSFTLPPNMTSVSGMWLTSKGNNNGSATVIFMDMSASTSIVPVYTSITGSAWNASGTKSVLLTFSYFIA